jgi:hypothetical protein
MIEEVLGRTPSPEDKTLSRAANQTYDVLSGAAHPRAPVALSRGTTRPQTVIPRAAVVARVV